MKLFLDWSAYKDAGMGDAYADIPKQGGDYAKAISVCINSRVCETTGRGVMCPSFRVTGRQELTPGGRVRLLKSLLNSEPDAEELNDKKLVEVMALCTACKGCKRECENEVDMALIKAEFQAQRNAEHGVTLRSRLFGNFPALLDRFPKGVPWLIRQRNRIPMLARLGEKLLGIDAETKMPERAADTVISGKTIAEEGERGKILLFADSFSRHLNPSALAAAETVLVAAGYQVRRFEKEGDGKPLCCGRSLLANGLVDEARAKAHQLINALLPFLDEGFTLVGLEPSCLLTLRDEYRALGLGEKLDGLEKKILLLEEFIAREKNGGRWQLEFVVPDEQEYLIHGHCHQKAVGATRSMRKVLKLIPGLKSRMIEASCCGMAGQFGYEAEHAGLARQMGELALFPALREAPQAQVVANGFSCQQQIINGGFQKPRHLAELLYRALPKS